MSRAVAAAGRARPAARTRAVASVVCVVLAALLTTPALAAHWARRTLLDTKRYIATTGPLATFPEVQDAIAQIAIDALAKRVDVRSLLARVTQDRARLAPLVPVLTAAVNGAVEREVRDFVASDAFEQLWNTVNTRAQQAFLRALRGEPSGGISVQGDTVVLDVSDVVDAIRQRLVARGLTVLDDVPVPDVDVQVVLFRSPQLATARTIYAVAAPLTPWALPVTGLLYLAAVALAVRRPRMVIVVGVAAVANGLLLALLLAVGRRSAVDQLAGTGLAPATDLVFRTLVANLERGWRVLMGLGTVVALAGWLAARTPPAPGVAGRWLAPPRSESSVR